ncbi:uncharacterized protein PV09_06300 [Verruconis gallopava]|uniref:Uncharacterized protein n=1 Tax=Verruconis gallopava TaxID=253628 RepID=A0A0D2A7K1_9PEZI|nr:uncharacterized protein PV09_06300 [Verruconis gallopava]KIW02500.1 hypothetical protein PV09_06300 [Verruconis gallopava]
MISETMYTVGTGAVFGAALTASRVHLPSVIINQLRLTDFHMMHVFAAALGSSAAVMFVLEKLNIIRRPIRPSCSLGIFSEYDGNLIGGAMVGVGMSLSGACPGTVLVQLAQGIPSGRAAALGALLGGVAYVKWRQTLKKGSGASNEKAKASKRTISEVSKTPEEVLYTILGLGVVGLIALTRPEGNVPPNLPVLGGLSIGLAQAASLLLTTFPLGVSTAYEELGQYIVRALGDKDVALPSWPPRSTIFALGLIGGSMAFSTQVASSSLVGPDLQIPSWQALAGGFIMSFGARIAGGCTSGHGLSGLGALSFSSLIAVAGMFSAGILVRQVM